MPWLVELHAHAKGCRARPLDRYKAMFVKPTACYGQV
jgi:hypothetical protein